MVTKRQTEPETEVTISDNQIYVKVLRRNKPVIYIFNVPSGAVGWKHLRIAMMVEKERSEVHEEYNPTSGEIETIKPPMTSREIEILDVAMDKWIETVLPEICVSHQFDDIPWVDLVPIFNAIMQDVSIDNTKFPDMEES